MSVAVVLLQSLEFYEDLELVCGVTDDGVLGPLISLVISSSASSSLVSAAYTDQKFSTRCGRSSTDRVIRVNLASTKEPTQMD